MDEVKPKPRPKRRKHGRLRRLTYVDRARRDARNIDRGRKPAPAPPPGVVRAERIKKIEASIVEHTRLRDRAGFGIYLAVHATRLRVLKHELKKLKGK